MQQIVAATDFSMRSQSALRRAGVLARQSGAKLAVLHVVDDDQPDELIARDKAEANKFLQEQVGALAELRDLSCQVVVGTGEAFSGILATARSLSTDLIVMGSHRKQLLRDVFVGTTIERVIRTGSHPVLLVNTPAEHSYRHVLSAMDLSEYSAHALWRAHASGFLTGQHVTLVHAFDAIARGKLFIANATETQIADYVGDERRRAQDELLALLVAHNIRPEGWAYRIEEGPPFEVISRVAEESTPDLIVVGTHGRSGMAKMLLGSVAEEVLRRLNIDILAVPPVRRVS